MWTKFSHQIIISPQDRLEVVLALGQSRYMNLGRLGFVPTQPRELTPLRFDKGMFAGRIAGGCGGVFPGDRGEGTVIGGVNLVQDLVGGVDDVRPEREVLGECELHFKSWFLSRGSSKM